MFTYKIVFFKTKCISNLEIDEMFRELALKELRTKFSY